MGSGLRERAFIRANPETQTGVIMASVPPARATSQAPVRSSRAAVWMAVAPEAQAVAVCITGPVAPNSMASRPAAMFGRKAGSVMGDTAAGPRVRRRSAACS